MDRAEGIAQTDQRWVSRGRPSSVSVLDPELPTFVDRDIGDDLKTWMIAAGRDGGFLTLVGNSCVGKNRLLYEIARQALPGFTLLVPDLGDGGLVTSLAGATFRLPRLIVWLDELQRFLPGPYFVPNDQSAHAPITAAAVRHLLTAATPVVILGTLWPERATRLRSHPLAVDILDSAEEWPVKTFSPDERVRTAEQAGRDPRLAAALTVRGLNVTEVLAGARHLLRRYGAASKTQLAVMHAAVDAQRVGIEAPLRMDLLRDAARGYLTRAPADDAWFDADLDELTSHTRRDDATTSPLKPIPAPDGRGTLGYEPAEYLLQHLIAKRRAEPIPDSTWRAFVEHTNRP
jgi:hypothetical protein